MPDPRIVLDTNVLVAASRSGRGASAELLSWLDRGRFDIVISVPLVLEYEDAVLRGIPRDSQRFQVFQDVLDYLCAVGIHQDVYFLWRPQLRDPKDDMVLEVAVAGRCEAIITYNLRDFGDLSRFAIKVLTPKDFLIRIGVLE